MRPAFKVPRGFMAGKETSEETKGTAKSTVSLEETAPEGGSIPLTFLRGNHFRVVPANGFMASLTLEGDIYLSPWHQHNDLPAQASIEVTPSGIREGSGAFTGMVREVDVALTFSPDVAVNLIQLLQRQLHKLTLRAVETPDAAATDDK
jgi:hypothetical protein